MVGGHAHVHGVLARGLKEEEEEARPGRRTAALPALLEAAHRGDAEQARRLLNGSGAVAVDAKTERGCTALMIAAEGGHAAAVEALLAARADPNARLLDGRNPLMLSCTVFKGDARILEARTRVVERLLEAKAHVSPLEYRLSALEYLFVLTPTHADAPL